MPQMGESIAEGTIVRWIKKVGDSVDRDEPLFEISTDKVDAEIPSPAAGVLTDIKVHEGETVPVNSVVATIGQPDEAVAAAEPSRPERPKKEAATPEQAGGHDAAASAKPAFAAGDPGAASARQAGGSAEAPAAATTDDRRRLKSSPLVRRIADEHQIDIAAISGTGIGGRVTKQDILDYIEGRAADTNRPAPLSAPASSEPAAPAYGQDHRVEVKPLSMMRKKIAEHMILSRRTSAHVHSVFHVDFSTIDKLREQKKAEYERMGAKLTFVAFIAKTVVDAIRRHPIINASIEGNNAIYKKDVNLGIAVALEDGLIVPVIKNADEKNLLGLSRAIADLATRARAKQLTPEEVHGGTFTITNPGQFGAQFGLPIINQPQSAILGVGTIEKRPVVVDEAIGIRTMAYLTLGFDHRLIDGAVADAFMADVKHQLENFDPNQL
jgi:2-oxoglutarate dehydrogenase E2 component (dihydrolipoamide succinyltransferase)